MNNSAKIYFGIFCMIFMGCQFQPSYAWDTKELYKKLNDTSDSVFGPDSATKNPVIAGIVSLHNKLFPKPSGIDVHIDIHYVFAAAFVLGVGLTVWLLKRDGGKQEEDEDLEQDSDIFDLDTPTRGKRSLKRGLFD